MEGTDLEFTMLDRDLAQKLNLSSSNKESTLFAMLPSYGRRNFLTEKQVQCSRMNAQGFWSM